MSRQRSPILPRATSTTEATLGSLARQVTVCLSLSLLREALHAAAQSALAAPDRVVLLEVAVRTPA